METEEEPEVQICDQDINPIVLDSSVSDPQQGLRPPGDFWYHWIQKNAAARTFPRDYGQHLG